MMRRRERILERFFWPFFIIFTISAVFTTIWLKSSIVSAEYKIRSLEERKKKLLMEEKLLSAEKSNILSVAKFENASAGKLVFPDRIKVVYVQRDKGNDTYKASFKTSLLTKKRDER